MSDDLQRLARYEILEEIGRGNMGVVYKARDPELDRVVAVKVVRLGFERDGAQRETYLERFRSEARIAGNLIHPHIVAVHDIDFSGDDPFIAMEYFPGESLSRFMEERGTPNLRDISIIVQQLASALEYAHGEGVVHRDIKPANVLIQPGPMIKLVDFGIAKVDSVDLTATGEFLGTPSYMSPEIFSGARVDGRSDLFSLGVIVYQLLTGVRPFEADNVSRTIYRVLHEDPPPPSTLRDEVSQDWDVVCERMLAKDPARRYPSAAALKADLDAIERGVPLIPEPTVAIEPPPPRSLGRRVTLLGVLLALLVVFVVRVPSTDPPPRRTAPLTPLVEETKRAIEGDSLERAEASLRALDAHDPNHPEGALLHEELDAARFEEALPLEHVARHEHRLGFCTGDLVLAEEELVFRSDHEPWHFARSGLDGVRLAADGTLVLTKGDETRTLTMLRPPLTRKILDRYRGPR